MENLRNAKNGKPAYDHRKDGMISWLVASQEEQQYKWGIQTLDLKKMKKK